MGAQIPIDSAVGSKPIATVESPIRSNVETKVFFRPTLSPKCPKMTEPSGRATKATPKVANARIVPLD